MSAPGIFVIGANHHRAPIEVREKLSLGAENEAALQAELAGLPGLCEFAVLNTCNRIEFYGVAADGEAAASVEAAFCNRQHFDAAEFVKFRMDLRGRDVLQHLVEVAVGLDSQMLGETEIFGQLKEAYAAAQARKSTGPVLNRVFQKAFQAAKHVRSSTAITVGQVSVANVAVELALNIFGTLAETRILLLGAGDIGEKTAKAFQSRGAASLTVSSRHIERAAELATQLGASALPFEQREARIADFDVIVCSTAAPNTVVSTVATAMAMGTARASAFLHRSCAAARRRDRRRRDSERLPLQPGRSSEDSGGEPRRPRSRNRQVPGAALRARGRPLAPGRAPASLSAGRNGTQP